MLKKSRKTISFLLGILISISTLSLIVVAQNESVGLNEDKIYEEYVSDVFSEVTFDKDSQFIAFPPVDKNDAENKAKSITLNFVGMSSFLDFSSVKHEVDKNIIKYESSNENVVVAYDERILATGIGTATVTISYNDQVQIVNVTVKNEIDKKIMERLESAYKSTVSMLSTLDDRSDIAQRAMDMVYVNWTPTSNLRKWHKASSTPIYFPANTPQWGIPYTWGIQCDEVDFIHHLNYSTDFYSVSEFSGGQLGDEKRYGPRYGSDCSGFVSFAWSVPRDNTYGFIDKINNGTYTELSGYNSLEKGDAVVTGPHMFLITINFEVPPSGSGYNEPYVVCYEQTPYNAQLTFHTYAQLSQGGYIPFSKF